MSTTKLMTIEEAEGRRDTVWDYELVRGEFRPLMPSGSDHSETGANFIIVVGGFVKGHRLGAFFSSDMGFILARDPDTLLSPDAAFVQVERMPSAPVRRGFLPLAPDLVLEVISQSTNRRELSERIEIYLRAGVRMVVVADPESHTCVIHRPDSDPVTIPSDGQFDGGDVLPGLRVPVALFFE